MPTLNGTAITRRRFFATSSAAAIGLATTRATRASTAPAKHAAPAGEDIVYEVTKTEAEWLEQLEEFEYFIMRKGLTEPPKTSELWTEVRDGTYHCKGCGLTSFDGRWKVILDKGWLFFHHAVPNAVLLGIDGPVAEYGQMADSEQAVTEVHCRRCGSHLGHLLTIRPVGMVHCINGTAMEFRQLDA
ncbi:MAG: peptide-methionine (R)-S-oxide reductase [Litoreibacter sp.]|nr:peptide-methionine (R)-S-oxide reductase [Litoreibacter sp.]